MGLDPMPIWLFAVDMFGHHIPVCSKPVTSSRHHYRKIPKYTDVQKFAVIILKLEQYRFTTE